MTKFNVSAMSMIEYINEWIINGVPQRDILGLYPFSLFIDAYLKAIQ